MSISSSDVLCVCVGGGGRGVIGRGEKIDSLANDFWK